MTNEITLTKQEFKLDLDAAGLTVLDYVPERIVPPIVIINSANPYLTPSSLGKEYVMSLELVIVAATATNKQATEKLDEAIADVLQALQNIRYARTLRVANPYNLQTGNAEYLATTVNVEIELTI